MATLTLDATVTRIVEGEKIFVKFLPQKSVAPKKGAFYILVQGLRVCCLFTCQFNIGDYLEFTDVI